MYFVQFVILSLVYWLVPAAIIYISSGYERVNLYLGSFALVHLILLMFSDKLILSLLGARELVRQDLSIRMLAQNLSYLDAGKVINVYKYKGIFPRVYYFESMGRRSIVIDEKLLKSLNQVQLSELTQYLVMHSGKSVDTLTTYCFLLLMLNNQLISLVQRFGKWLRLPKGVSRSITYVFSTLCITCNYPLSVVLNYRLRGNIALSAEMKGIQDKLYADSDKSFSDSISMVIRLIGSNWSASGRGLFELELSGINFLGVK